MLLVLFVKDEILGPLVKLSARILFVSEEGIKTGVEWAVRGGLIGVAPWHTNYANRQY